MRLPPELRHMILRQLNVKQEPLCRRKIYPESNRSEEPQPPTDVSEKQIPRRWSPFGIESHVLRVCQQIYEEAHVILYEENILLMEIDEKRFGGFTCTALGRCY